MSKQSASIALAKTYLCNIVNDMGFVMVTEKDNLAKNRYYVCPTGADSSKISLLFFLKEDSARIPARLSPKNISYERVPTRPEMVKVTIKSLVEAYPLERDTTLTTEKPVTPNQIHIQIKEKDSENVPVSVSKQEIVTTTSETQRTVRNVIEDMRNDPKSGYSNSCSKEINGVKYRIFFFKTLDQATSLKNTLSEIADGITIGGKGVKVPTEIYNIGLKEKPVSSKKKKVVLKKAQVLQYNTVTEKKVDSKPSESAVEEPIVQSTKTSDDLLIAFKQTLRSEVELEMLEEFAQISEQLAAANSLVNELTERIANSYLVPKNEMRTMTFSFAQVGKGIAMVEDGFVIDKELLTALPISEV